MMLPPSQRASARSTPSERAHSRRRRFLARLVVCASCLSTQASRFTETTQLPRKIFETAKQDLEPVGRASGAENTCPLGQRNLGERSSNGEDEAAPIGLIILWFWTGCYSNSQAVPAPSLSFAVQLAV